MPPAPRPHRLHRGDRPNPRPRHRCPTPLPGDRTIAPTNALQQALAVIEQAPESASALTLYALVNTLEYERAGCLFKLTKLRDLAPPHRAIAYGLMDLLVEQGIGDDLWTSTKARMDRAIRGQ